MTETAGFSSMTNDQLEQEAAKLVAQAHASGDWRVVIDDLVFLRTWLARPSKEKLLGLMQMARERVAERGGVTTEEAVARIRELRDEWNGRDELHSRLRGN